MVLFSTIYLYLKLIKSLNVKVWRVFIYQIDHFWQKKSIKKYLQVPLKKVWKKFFLKKSIILLKKYKVAALL